MTKIFKQKKSFVPLLLIFTILALGISACGASAPADTATLPLEVSVQDGYNFYKDGGYILDVRTQDEWNAGHVPGATLITLDQLENHLSELPTDEPIYVICRSGNRSAVARDTLLQNGFETVTSIGGGFNQWVANGYPAVTGP